MRSQSCLRLFAPPAFAAGAMALLALPASAAEVAYCVTCENPNQTYVCRLKSDRSRPSDAMKLYCTIRTAKDGNHSSCTARHSDGNCPGVEKIYNFNIPDISPEIADKKMKKLQSKISKENGNFAKPKEDGAPKTIVEMTGRAYSASRDRMRKIGGSNDAATQAPAPPPQAAAPPAPPPQAATQPATPIEPAGHQANDAVPATTASVAPPSEGTGSRMKTAARKSWRCMRSFFFNCSEEEPDPTAGLGPQ